MHFRVDDIKKKKERESNLHEISNLLRVLGVTTWFEVLAGKMKAKIPNTLQ